MTHSDTLQRAIDGLSSKKHVIHPDISSEVAQKHSSDVKLDAKQSLLLEELNQSVRILTSIFHTSNFDELLLLSARPLRLFVLNFFMGFLRGLGFALGVVIILFMVMTYFFPQILEKFLL
ncbi:MAG: hypothetical protein VW378_04010 [bacterium]